MSALRDPKHERIALLVAQGLTPKEAHNKVCATTGQSASAKRQQLHRIMRRADVLARIQELRDMIAQRVAERSADATVASREWIERGLIEIVQRCMQKEPVLVNGIPTGEWKFDGRTALQAYALLGKDQGMFVDKSEAGKPGDFSRLTAQELAQKAALLEAENALRRARKSSGKGMTIDQVPGKVEE